MAGNKPGSGGAAVIERTATMPEGMIKSAGSSVDYWSDDRGKPTGADVHCWRNADGTRQTWKAAIRWKPDLESGGSGGQFQMTYPNPGGGADYIVAGRQQLGPLVDQAMRLGQKAVFGDAFIT